MLQASISEEYGEYQIRLIFNKHVFSCEDVFPSRDAAERVINDIAIELGVYYSV